MNDLLPEEPSLRSPIADAPLSIILLVTGTTSDAAESIAAWKTYFATLARPFELLLVPLVEPDPNPALADVPCMPYDAVRGIGPALQAAVRAAQHPLIVLTTADWQYEPADLKALLAIIDKVDIVIGCRSMPRPPLWWRMLSAMGRAIGWLVIGLPLQGQPCSVGATRWRLRWVARWGFGVRLIDPASPFRLMRRDAAARVVLQSRGWFAFVEQLAKANHLEFILAEEPVAWAPAARSRIESAPFGEDARAVFRHPDFGPAALHVPPAVAALPENPAAPPTTPPSCSSEQQGPMRD